MKLNPQQISRDNNIIKEHNNKKKHICRCSVNSFIAVSTRIRLDKLRILLHSEEGPCLIEVVNSNNNYNNNQ